MEHGTVTGELLRVVVSPQWTDLVDFVLLVVICYLVLWWAARSRALRFVVAIAGLHFLACGASTLGLRGTGAMLELTALAGLLALLVLFQPEVRHAFVSVDRWVHGQRRRRTDRTHVYREVSNAAFRLAEKGIGAVMVVAALDSLSGEVGRGGERVDAAVSADLLETIFLKDSNLHDGAAIIEGTRLTRAGAVLPVSPRENLPREYGTRHRAGIGFNECCNVPVVVVSEERRQVTLMHDRGIYPVADPPELQERLRKLNGSAGKGTIPLRRDVFRSSWKLKGGAVALAALIHTAVVLCAR